MKPDLSDRIEATLQAVRQEGIEFSVPWADAEEQAPSDPGKNNVNADGSDRLKHKKGTAVLLTRAAPKRSPT